MGEPAIVEVRPGDEALIARVRELLDEYCVWLGTLVSTRNLRNDRDALPGVFAPPTGMLLVAAIDDEVVGCAGVRPFSGDTCEMKRLYVTPGSRRKGVGRALAMAAIDTARVLGYRRMVLNSIEPAQSGAVRLYRSFGFVDTAPYKQYEGPMPEMTHLELDLTATAGD